MPLTTTIRRLTRILPTRTGHVNSMPEKIVLGVDPHLTPSTKPPVRIFLGTESSQFRAERVFVWSVDQHRDRSRIYEIYLMKELGGFDERGWTTGFTNYRFAIPHFAGGAGRAIYNDVDQIYLADPAELFDREMGRHGFLAISEADSSVMLIDCARMASIWSLQLAQRQSKKSILKQTLEIPEIYGTLPPEWNARDEEYRPERSKLLHYTTLHTQPWRPFPDQFIYEDHPYGDLWQTMEREADAASFQLFTRDAPSRRYREWRQQTTSNGAVPSREIHSNDRNLSQYCPIATLVASTHLRGLLVLGGTPSRDQKLRDELQHAGFQPSITRIDANLQALRALPDQIFDGVLCLDLLQELPGDDLAWVLDELFTRALRFLYVTVSTESVATSATYGQSPDWWQAHMEAASRRHPNISWHLAVSRRVKWRDVKVIQRHGGPCHGESPPRMWILTDDRPGNTTQSVGLADALGWTYEQKNVRFPHLSILHNRILGASTVSLDRRRSDPLEPPWPDVVIASGRRLGPVARWIAEQSGGHTRLVQLGRKAGQVADWYDVVITPSYCRLPSHPRRIEVAAPLTRITSQHLAEAAKQWQPLLDGVPRPRLVLLVGGPTLRHRLSTQIAYRMGQEVANFAREAGGTVVAVTSRRTGEPATTALEQGIGSRGRVIRWHPGPNNPYLGYLACADVLVVTGDSESMLAEAAATDKPLYIYPLPKRPPGPRLWVKLWVKEWVTRRAQARPENNRGTVRPQGGLEYFCAWLLAQGWIRPPRRLDDLHQTLYRLGVAHPFGHPLEVTGRSPLRENERVARQVKQMLGVGSPTNRPASEFQGSVACNT